MKTRRFLVRQLIKFDGKKESLLELAEVQLKEIQKQNLRVLLYNLEIKNLLVNI